MTSQNKTMERVFFSLLLFLVIGLTAGGMAQDLTADELIAKNIDACGGQAAWDQIQSMKITGTYTNFSDPEKFTILRQRPDLYRFDCKRLHQLTVHAYDGKQAWWINPMMGPEFTTPGYIPTGQNLEKVTLRERFIEPVFWNYKAKGHQVELIGKEDLDGDEVYHLKITLKDGSEENWFFSTETFLAVSMTGITYDFGAPSPVETFFSKYKKVGNVVMPYLIESEYSIRYRVYDVDTIELNPQIDVAEFKLPK